MDNVEAGCTGNTRSWPVMRVLWVALVGLGLASCESSKEGQTPQPVISTPLELDPTEHYELSRWWYNGDELLRLDDNAGYVLFDQGNRYHTPLERGRWSQQNYASLWLEPYSRLRPERKRVEIAKLDGKLALNLPKLKPMFAIDRPPAVLEDRLIGGWAGQLGVQV